MREIDWLYKKLSKEGINKVHCGIERGSVHLNGETQSWQQVIVAGKLAAKLGSKGVVNNLVVKDLYLPPIIEPEIHDNALGHKAVDVLIIGGGVIGTAAARELSKWNISILLVEKEADVAMHTSSRNDGMVHPGIEPRPGSKKAYYNVKGNSMYDKISKDLGVDFKRCGSTVLFDNYMVRLAAPIIRSRAEKNKVKGITFLNKRQVKEIEPNITEDIVGALHFDSTGVLSPYRLVMAYGENAAENGVEFSFNTIVKQIVTKGNTIVEVVTNRGIIIPKLVINAAGVYSDSIAEMAGDRFFTIHPRKGEILLLDKKKGQLLNGVVAKPNIAIAKSNTKGGGVVKTIEGNILIGPDAYEQPYKEDYSTSKEHIDALLKKHLPVVPALNRGDVITYFAGTRAATYEEDFIIEASEGISNLVHAAGIQSPGLASAPAISEEIERLTIMLLKELGQVNKKEHFNPIRRAPINLSKLSWKERAEVIKKNKDYGIILCRCEEISKGEIIDALHSPLPVTTVDGLKRRTRAGMGRCQGGFCTPYVMELLSESSHVDMLSITKKGGGSSMVVEETKTHNHKGAV